MFLGLPGGSEWLIVLALVLILFGAKKIPDLARGMGKGITEFKKGLKEEPGSDSDTQKIEGGGSTDAGKDNSENK